MILEIADIRIRKGQQAEFEQALRHAIATVLPKANGVISAKIQHSIESPERYVLMIEWATLEDHTVGFRGGELFPAWRAIIGPFFDGPPNVEHFDAV